MCTLLDAAMGFALQLPACRPVPRALRALCGSTGCASAPRACAPHSRPTLRCAAAGGKDRGEWTRFLAWSESDGSHRASVECVVVDGGGTAEVTVVAPDRPGLLSDVTATIASLGLNIEKARDAGAGVGNAGRCSAGEAAGTLLLGCILCAAREPGRAALCCVAPCARASGRLPGRGRPAGAFSVGVTHARSLSRSALRPR